MNHHTKRILLSSLLIFSTSTFADEPATNLNGQYIGYYSLTMNTADPVALKMLTLPKTELNGVEYIVLGQSIGQPLWIWDFDTKTVTWAGDKLYAMYMVTPDYQLFNLSAMPERKDDTELDIASTEEITMPFTDNNDGTYSIDYALKIYLQMAGYPIGQTSTTFSIIKTPSGQLTIETVDSETDGPDGVPGSRIAGVFPYVVQPQFVSTVMINDDGKDTDDDGITDIQAELLSLNPDSSDNDKDGKKNADEIGQTVRPYDTDKDGIADIYEAEYESDASAAQGMKLSDNSVFTFKSRDNINISATSIKAHEATSEGTLLLQTDEKEEISYKELEFSLDAMSVITGGYDQLQFSIEFSEESPAYFNIYEKITKVSYSPETKTGSVGVTINPVEYTTAETDNKIINLDLPYTAGDSVRKTFLIGTLAPDIETPTPGAETPDDKGSNDSSSAGSFSLLTVLMLFLPGIFRKRLSKQKSRSGTCV